MTSPCPQAKTRKAVVVPPCNPSTWGLKTGETGLQDQARLLVSEHQKAKRERKKETNKNVPQSVLSSVTHFPHMFLEHVTPRGSGS